jgi:hypothetical protein
VSGSGNWGKVRSAVQTFGPRLDEKEARIKDLMRTVAEQHHTRLEDEQRRTKVEQELRCVLFDDCCSRCGHALVRRGVVAVEGRGIPSSRGGEPCRQQQDATAAEAARADAAEAQCAELQETVQELQAEVRTNPEAPQPGPR